MARDGIRRCCATGATPGGGVRAFQIDDRLRLADASMVSTLEAVRICLIFLGSAGGGWCIAEAALGNRANFQTRRWREMDSNFRFLRRLAVVEARH